MNEIERRHKTASDQPGARAFVRIDTSSFLRLSRLIIDCDVIL